MKYVNEHVDPTVSGNAGAAMWTQTAGPGRVPA